MLHNGLRQMPPATITEDAVDLIEELNRQHKDLRDYKIPHLRDYKGTLVGQQQYATEIRESMERFSQLLQSLELLVDDQPRKRLQEELAIKIEEYRNIFGQLRVDSRIALLTSKRTLDSQTQSSREELFRSPVVKEKMLDEKESSTVMNASNNVTEALQRTINLMQGELERSVLSVQMLEESSASLRSTTTIYDTLDTLLDTSKHLIIALQKSDWMDRLLLFGALIFFFLVCLFILKQRVLDKTFQAAFWWTRFLPSFSNPRISSVDVGRVHSASMDSLDVVAPTISHISNPEVSSATFSDVVKTLTSSLSTPAHEEL